MKIAGLAPTPPMGWNSFDCYGRSANERVMLANLEAMAERLAPVGYEYLVLDIGWYGDFDLAPGEEFPRQAGHADRVCLDRYGRYLPAENRFPRGLAPLIEATHSRGLKFGLHIMRGIPREAVRLNLSIYGTNYRAGDIANIEDTCRWCLYNYGIDMRKPGAQEYYNSYIDLLAGWGVDFIKADDIVEHPAEIEAVANAIERQERPIALSLSPGGSTNLNDLAVYQRANMVRTTPDIWDRRADIDKSFDAWERFAGAEFPGFWPDLDMIPFGRLQVWRPADSGISEQELLSGAGHARDDRFTSAQRRTFITQHALAASPLFMGGDLPASSEEAFALITNPEMIRCNQNGIMGRKILSHDAIEVWQTPEREWPDRGWLGIFNRNKGALHYSARNSDLGFTPGQQYHFFDIWKDQKQVFGNSVEFSLDADDVAFVHYRRIE